MTGALGPVTVLGAHILDVLGRPVEAIPPGQGSARLTEIRATAAGTAAGTGVDLAKLGFRRRDDPIARGCLAEIGDQRSNAVGPRRPRNLVLDLRYIGFNMPDREDSVPFMRQSQRHRPTEAAQAAGDNRIALFHFFLP